MKQLNQSPLLKRCEAQSRRQKRGALTGKAAREVQRDVGPQLAHAVEWHKHGRTARSLLITQTDMKLTRPVSNRQSATIGIGQFAERLPESDVIDRARRIEPRRRGLQDQRPR